MGGRGILFLVLSRGTRLLIVGLPHSLLVKLAKMKPATVVEVNNLSKSFCSGKSELVAVNNLSFSAKPGRVTGFLGPNGAGKSTSLRCLLELVRPTSGTATFNGLKYSELNEPAKLIGVSLGFSGIHPGRSAFKHLQVCAIAAGIEQPRIDYVLDLLGLTHAAHRKAGGFSTGMKQRLSLATALLGDPQVVILDEPVNGLDPEGIVEVRHLLRELASEGKTILLSSHVLSEVQQTVDDVVIIRKGTKVKDCSLAELVAETKPLVKIVTPTPDRFKEFTQGECEFVGQHVTVTGALPREIGHWAFSHGVEIHELFEESLDIEQVFLQLTGDANA